MLADYLQVQVVKHFFSYRGIDSPVAGMEMMKRGVKIEAIHFHSPPFTSEKAKDKVIELTRILSERVGPIKLHIVPFTALQNKSISLCIHDIP